MSTTTSVVGRRSRVSSIPVKGDANLPDMRMPSLPLLTSIEVCAGAGGQAIGLHRAGFTHLACVELDKHAVATLQRNAPDWNPVLADLREWTWAGRESVDLVAGGVPCPPFSIAGQRLGSDDERDLFPAILRLIEDVAPRAVIVENVKGLLTSRFDEYRMQILKRLDRLGYVGEWRLLHAADFGVPQLRPRSVLVAMRAEYWRCFSWPEPTHSNAYVHVGAALRDKMASAGWEGADAWAKRAAGVAPTLVGGSKKHGGADLGPTRAKRDWLERLGVDAKGLADAPPPPGFQGAPRLTVEMAAVIQGFPPDWKFEGGKTSAYRQVGNAFPPPVAEAVGRAVATALASAQQRAS